MTDTPNANRAGSTIALLSQTDKDACVHFALWVWDEIKQTHAPDSFDIEEKLRTLGIIEEHTCNPEDNEWGADTWLVLKQTLAHACPQAVSEPDTYEPGA